MKQILEYLGCSIYPYTIRDVLLIVVYTQGGKKPCDAMLSVPMILYVTTVYMDSGRAGHVASM